MPANSRWDLIRRLRVNELSSPVASSGMCMISIVTISHKASEFVVEVRQSLTICPKVCLQAPVILTPCLLFSSESVTPHNVQVATYQQLHSGCPLRGQFNVSRTRTIFSVAYIVYPHYTQRLFIARLQS